MALEDTFQEYVTPDGLNIDAILRQYQAYVRRRGFRAFDTEKLKSEGLTRGYYVVFSPKHTNQNELYLIEDIDGVEIYIYIILTNFNPASTV